jgi:hypothetical protein
MKEIYITPEITITEFEEKDVVTSSVIELPPIPLPIWHE